MNEQSSSSSGLSIHLSGRSEWPSTGRATAASTGLEYDNSNLRQKLHELREEKSQLICENHSLVSEVEKVRFELHCTVGQLRPLQEAAEEQRLREEELARSLLEARTSSEQRESERREWEERYVGCSLQLKESNSLIQHQTEMLLALKQELTDLSASKKGAEADHDVALASVEQMRESFVDFQTRLQSRLHSAEDQLSSSYDEREKLLADLVKRCMEIESLQNVQEQLRSEVATQRSSRESVETQNSQLLARLSDYVPQMEAELKRCEMLRNENHELKASLEDKCEKLKCYEAELQDDRTQLADLESLALKLQNSIVTSLKSCDRCECVALPAGTEENGGGKRLENAAVVEELRSKLALAERELEQLRRKNANENNNDDCCEVLNGALCETEEDMEGAFQFEGRTCTDNNWEASMEKLEEERQQQAATISTLERRIADLEVDKVSLGAQLAQRNCQVDDLQRDMHEHSVKAATTERSLRRAAMQTSALDRQLDEKSTQVTTLVSQVDALEECLRTKSDELQKLERLTEQRVEEALGSGEAAKRMSEKRCRELRAELETAESKHRVTLHQLEQTERRSMSLEQTLNEMSVVVSTLRQELQQSGRLLHEQKDLSDGKIQKLESTIHQQREALKAGTAKQQTAEEQHHVEFSSMAKRVSDLEEELRRTTEAADERNDRLERLERELKEKQARILEGCARIEELEGLRSAVEREKEEREQAFSQEMSGMKALLESNEKKLGMAMADAERREQQAGDLARTIRDLQLEKKQIIDELGNELRDTLKQLKNERRGAEKMSSDMVSLQRENKCLTETLAEKDELAESLEKQIGDRDAELEENSQTVKELFAECEKRKLENETKEIRATELESRLKGRETELEVCRDEVETLQGEMRRCRDELRSRQSVVDELNQELEQRQWDLEQRAARVTQLDMATKERLAESEQRVVRLETALQKAQLEVHQHGKQSNDLTEQTKTLMAALRQKSRLVHELEQVVRQLKAELDGENKRVMAHCTTIEALGLEREGLVLSKRRSQEELTKTSDQLQALQERLDKCEQRLNATQAEFDRATESLSDARNSLKSQKSELEKLLEALTKADGDRTRLSEHLKRSEKEYRLVNDQLSRELTQLRDAHAAARSGLEEELAGKQCQLKAAEDNRQQLMLELKRAGQQVSSLQMELDATRMIASATKETSLIKDGEIARLRARISSITRSQVSAAMETGCYVEPGLGGCGHEQADDCGCLDRVPSCDGVPEQRPFDGVGCQSDDAPCKNDFPVVAGSLSLSSMGATGNCGKVGGGKFPSAASGNRSECSGFRGSSAMSLAGCQPCQDGSLPRDGIPCSGEMPPCLEPCFDADDTNPDSLQAMWNQLQQGRKNAPPIVPSHSSTNSDREPLPDRRSLRGGCTTTSTGTSDPKRCASTAHCNDPVRSGGCGLDERLRVQNRIKALIGYKEPARKTCSKSSISSDSSTSSRSSVLSRQPVTGGRNSRGGGCGGVSTTASQLGKSCNSTKRRNRCEGQTEMLDDDTDCSLST